MPFQINDSAWPKVTIFLEDQTKFSCPQCKSQIFRKPRIYIPGQPARVMCEDCHTGYEVPIELKVEEISK